MDPSLAWLNISSCKAFLLRWHRLLLLCLLTGNACLVQSPSLWRGMPVLPLVPAGGFQHWWTHIVLPHPQTVSQIFCPARYPLRSVEPHWMEPVSHHRAYWSKEAVWRRSTEQVHLQWEISELVRVKENWISQRARGFRIKNKSNRDIWSGVCVEQVATVKRVGSETIPDIISMLWKPVTI